MSKLKRMRENSSNPFAEEETPTTSNIRDSDGDLFGNTAQAEAKRGERLKKLSIFDIEPDPTQPRRTIPSAVRNLWNGAPTMLGRMFADWESLAQQECGNQAPLIRQRLDGQEVESDDSLPPITDALLKLVTLAIRIKQEGLTNPITVVEYEPSRYRLVTGERRWLAHHLLYAYSTGDKQWSNIAAQVVKRTDRFAQASENTARGNLNMVARSRQWALLVMAQHEASGEYQFAPYGEFEKDVDYYRQVGELAALDAAAVMSACGVRNKASLSQYRKVLNLSPQDWTRADDENWGRRQIDELLGVIEESDAEGRFTAVNPPSTKHKKRTKPKGFDDHLATFISSARKHKAKASADERRATARLLRQLADEMEQG